jgi:hypothetical protein
MKCVEEWRWRSHVRSQVRSGLSQAVYCRIYAIPVQVFARWRRRMWAEDLPPLVLLPVRVSPAAQGNG